MKIKKNRRKYKLGGADIAAAGLGGAGTGAQIGTMIAPGIGTAIGAGVGALGGIGASLLGERQASRDARRLERQGQRQASENANRIAEIGSRGTLATYPTMGVPGVDRFGMGGRLDIIPMMLGNGGQVYANGGNINMFSGPKHEQGGIPLDMNNDGVAEAEVEGGEAFDGKTGKIYSDALKINQTDVDAIKELTGMKVKEGDTIADAVNKISSKTNKLEDANLPLSKQTNAIMESRMNSALDYLYQRQDDMAIQPGETMRNGGQLAGMKQLFGGLNVVSRPASFRYGGRMKYQFGNDPSSQYDFINGQWVPKSNNTLGFGQTPFINDISTNRNPNVAGSDFGSLQNPGPIPDAQFNSGQGVRGDGYFWTDNLGRQVADGIAQSTANIPDSNSVNPVTAPRSFNEIPVEARNTLANAPAVGSIGSNVIPDKVIDPVGVGSNTAAPQVPGAPGTGMPNIGPALGQIANFINFRANARDIGRLDTNVSPSFVRAPSFRFDDPSIAARNQNNVITRNAINDLRRNTSQGSQANIAALKSAQIMGNNQALSQATQQKNQAMQDFGRQVNRVNAMNAGIANQNELTNTNLRNQSLAMRQQNRRAFVDGILGNIQTGQTNQLERDRMTLAAMGQGGTGVSDRMLAELERQRESQRFAPWLQNMFTR